MNDTLAAIYTLHSTEIKVLPYRDMWSFCIMLAVDWTSEHGFARNLIILVQRLLKRLLLCTQNLLAIIIIDFSDAILVYDLH